MSSPRMMLFAAARVRPLAVVPASDPSSSTINAALSPLVSVLVLAPDCV